MSTMRGVLVIGLSVRQVVRFDDAQIGVEADWLASWWLAQGWCDGLGWRRVPVSTTDLALGSDRPA
jgi:hypothetical protein